MNDWIIKVICVVLLTSILSLIVPENSIGKNIKGIFSLITVLVVITPLINSFQNGFNFQNNAYTNSIVLQEDFLINISEKRIELLKDECISIFKKNNLDVENCVISYEISNEYEVTVKKVHIYLNNLVINSNLEHKNIIEKCKNEIKNYIGINIENILVYE